MGSTNSTIHTHKIFTLILFPNSSQGLIQLGGFDPSQAEKWSHLESDDALPNLHQQITLPILTDCVSFVMTKDCPFRNYRVGIHRIRFGLSLDLSSSSVSSVGNHILFESTKEFEDEIESDPKKNLHEPQLSGVIDSGTTCLIFPSRIGSKKIYSSIFLNTPASRPDLVLFFIDLYEDFLALFSLYSSSELPSLFVRFTSTPGHRNVSDLSDSNYLEVEIPPSLYTLPYAPSTGPNSLCIFSIPEYPSLMILGDVFLQAAVVLHNLTSRDHPTLTVFPRQWKHSQTQKERLFENQHDARPFEFESTTTSVIGVPIQKSIRLENTSHWKQERLPFLLSLPPPPSFPSGEDKPFSARQHNEVLLQEIMGIQYIAKIGIGTPRQGDIPVIVDTGSGELVLM
jgi:hypothetical protein